MIVLNETFGWKFDEELDYMTLKELELLKTLISKNEISFFRLKKCVNCGCDIIKNKIYCSKKCKFGSEI